MPRGTDDPLSALHASVQNRLAATLLICRVDHIDAPGKLAWLLRPGQLTLEPNARGYLGGQDVVAGLTVAVVVNLTIAGETHTTTSDVVIRTPLAKGDQVLAVETGGTLFIVDRVDK